MRLAPGTELLGQWDGSAYREAPYLIRRADGQHVQVSPLLYQLASGMESATDIHDLATRLSGTTGRDISVENVVHLLKAKLAPLGILATDGRPDGSTPGANPLLALRFRAAIVPARAHRGVTTALTFLFWPPLVVLALIGLVAADIWIGVSHGTALLTGVNQTIAHPTLLLALAAMTLVAAVVHETGHATATRAGGATPGVMGAGIYLVWPVFYTDISDSYRLGRGGRLRADLGGVYFNALTLLAASMVYALTHWAVLLVFIVITHIEVVSQFLPFVRLDGYWVVSDLIGVPNLFAFLGPTLAKLLRRSSPVADGRMAQVKPWARKVITAWVVATAFVLAVDLAMVLWLGPLLVARTAGAVASRGHQLGTDVAEHRVVSGADDLLSTILLAVPAAGITYMGLLLLGRAFRTIGRWRKSRPLLAAVSTALLAGLAGYQTLTLVGSHHAHPTRPAALPAVYTTTTNHPDTARTPSRTGTWTVAASGAVTTTGQAHDYGSAETFHLVAPAVAMASTPDGRGYWLAGADGGVFAFGDARFYGSVANVRLDGPVVAIAGTPDGRGYWLAAADGGVFAFGDARFYGSLGGAHVDSRIIGLAARPAGDGYWLASRAGQVFAFGHAPYLGSNVTGSAPVTAVTTTADGYRLYTATGSYARGP